MKCAWKEIILLWIVLNVGTVFFSRAYAWIMPYYTVVVAGLFVVIAVLKANNKRIVERLILLYLVLIGFFLIQGKNPLAYLTILSSPIAFFCFDGISITERQEKRLAKVFFVCWGLLVVLSYNYFARYSRNSSGMINSNTMGLYLLNVLMFLVYFWQKKSKNVGWLAAIIAVSVVAFFKGYQSRGCLLALAFFLFVMFFRGILFKKKARVLVVSACAIAIGVVVPIAYVALINAGFFGQSDYGAKNVFTRMNVWSELINSFGANKWYWIVGLPREQLLVVGQSIHNNSLEVLANVGVIGFAVYFLFVLWYLNSILSKADYSRKSDCLVVSFVTLLLLGVTEVTFFWAITYPLHYCYLGLASGEKKDLLQS